MGPPPPPPVSQSPEGDIQQLYKQLKRRYADLERRFDAMSLDFNRATDQNRRLSQERKCVFECLLMF